jgi:poly(hydroxyalkanoate) depolymerase family esterase
MRLPKTMKRLARLPRVPRIPKGVRAFAPAAAPKASVDRLTDLPLHHGNPGHLAARCYVPEGLKPGAPLVVVLHGCTQSAALYDQGSGWSHLADRHGFALLYPEQSRSNNPNLCFNWYQRGDAQRGGGEAASIAAMVGWMTEAHELDPARVFVTGLSAGGAMASVMLAAYPDLFAAGAIIAGLPYGCASGLGQAFECMAGRGEADAVALGRSVRQASGHSGPWPRVSVWHGSGDHLVVPSNGEAIVKQWLDVHGLPGKPDSVDSGPSFSHRVWSGPDGAPLVEHVLVSGMGHGVPLNPGDGDGRSGQAGPHMLDVGVSSTDRIARFFGIADSRAAEAPGRKAAPRPAPADGSAPRAAHPEPASAGVQKVIEDALKSAGLMR